MKHKTLIALKPRPSLGAHGVSRIPYPVGDENNHFHLSSLYAFDACSLRLRTLAPSASPSHAYVQCSKDR